LSGAARIRVLTWNIHGSLGRNKRFDLERVVALIDRWDPQIVALQEVDSRRDRAAGINPFEFLQRELGEHGIGAKSITTDDGDYGQMLISRWPMRDVEVHDISWPEREPRRVITAVIEAPAGSIRIAATHLGLSIHERRGQARRLMEIAGRSDMTTVVVGDFNDWFWPGSITRALTCELPGCTAYRTFPSWWPVLRLDRIYCRPAGALLRSFTDPAARQISDHLPVIADIRATARAAGLDAQKEGAAATAAPEMHR
jgi:endonuclease/exonuclease/phosphatase family metal-dependent hydrolase